MTVLGLLVFRVRAFSSCGKRGPLFIAVRGPLFIAVRGPLFIAVRGPLFIAVRGPPTIAAPPVAGHRLQTRRLSSCGSRAQSLRGTRDPPRPGLEPASPALAGRLPTTAPPGKPLSHSSWGWDVLDQSAGWFGSWWEFSSWLADGCLLAMSSHGRERERERDLLKLLILSD